MKIILDHDRCTLLHGDSAKLGELLGENSVDSIVCDPPSGVAFMGKEWDKDKGGRDQWVRWLADLLAASYRALKPGGYALFWALPRTSHWTATAVEEAGFEVRDIINWLYGSGFPKSLDASKAIDAKLGLTAQRPVVGTCTNGVGNTAASIHFEEGFAASREKVYNVTAAASPEAARWAGWGTALKPACEHWILARKPLDGTVAENLLKWGTGAINIGGCRIGDEPRENPERPAAGGFYNVGTQNDDRETKVRPVVGRWPANLALDEEAAAMLDEQSGTLTSGARKAGVRQGRRQGLTYGDQAGDGGPEIKPSSGGASRFFYVAKPPKSETELGLDHLPKKTGGEATDREDGTAGLNSPRAGAGRTGGARNHHPTKKPVQLMRYLCRLVTPPGGIVLDPFAGSGSTGVAALAEGLCFIGCELTDEYIPILEGRIRHALGTAAPAGA